MAGGQGQRWPSLLRWLPPALLLAAGIAGSVAVSGVFQQDARSAWEAAARKDAQFLTGTLLGWLEESYGAMSGVAALFENSSEVTRDEFLNAFDAVESRATAFFLDGIAIARPGADINDAASWSIVKSSESFGILEEGFRVGDSEPLTTAMAAAIDRFSRTVLGPALTTDAGDSASPVVLVTSSPRGPLAIVGLLNHSALVDGIYSVHTPTGAALEIAGRFAVATGRSDLRPVLETRGGAPVAFSSTSRTASAESDLSITWLFAPDYAGGPDTTLATGAMWSGISITVLIALFVTLLIARNQEITRRVEAATAELSAAKEQAEDAARAKADFLANMSHEIRTPMNAVIGLTNLALQTQLDEKQKDYLGKIESSATSLLGIINDILDFSKIDAGMMTVEQVPFDLHVEVLENLSNVVGLRAAEKGLELLFDFEPDLPHSLIGDPLRIGQILTNFCNNAVKFTEAGEITLRIRMVSREDDRIELRMEVQDTGIGMTQQQIDQLFQEFSQADTSITRKYGGTGLGLTISKRLAELMDGTVGVSSEPGVGSVFWFSAWLGVAEEQDAALARSFDVQVEGLRVLVVDDNPTARMILARYLKAFGYSVEEASDGAGALARLADAPADAPFDLVLMDWKMPEMDGLEATRQIKQQGDLAKIPAVMMVTAFDREALQDEAQGVDLDGILVKPVSQSTLLDGIMRAFGKETANRSRGAALALPEHCVGARLLLVEDNEINQQVATEILHKAGCAVTVAVNGSHGVQTLRDAPDGFDAVLMDIQMPVMDGYTAAREIRKDARFTDLPIIAMTANAFASDREKALDSGMNDHVAKPIEVKALFDALGQWVTVPEDRRTPPPPTADASTEPDLELPPLRGVDMAGALARLGGNASLYRDLLIGFAADQADAADRIGAALSLGDDEGAKRDAHTVKGVAANLGMDALSRHAAALEAAIGGGEPTNAPLAALETSLADAVAAVRDALPAAPAEAADTVDGPTAELTTGAPILIAEDSPINQKILARQVATLGYDSDLADDGAQALAMLAEHPYRLLLTDIEMPELDGLALTRKIREGEDGGAHLPVLAVTGTLDDAQRTRCAEAGMDGCLEKPVDMDLLKAELTRYLETNGIAPSDDSADEAAPAEAQAAEAAVDPSLLEESFGDDPELIKEILQDYLGPAQDTVAEIDTAFSAHDAAAIGAAAHKLKSSSRAIGANDLADLCLELEKAGKGDDWPVIEARYPALAGNLQRVTAFIDAL